MFGAKDINQAYGVLGMAASVAGLCFPKTFAPWLVASAAANPAGATAFWWTCWLALGLSVFVYVVFGHVLIAGPFAFVEGFRTMGKALFVDSIRFLLSPLAEDKSPVWFHGRGAEVDHDLGPFAPPCDYRVEPELEGPAPRVLPPWVRRSPCARNHQLEILLMLGLAALWTAAPLVPVVHHALIQSSLLRVVFWVGFAAMFLIPVKMLMNGPPAFGYIRNGVSLVGRVIKVERTFLRMDKDIALPRDKVTFEFNDPSTKALQVASAEFNPSKESQSDPPPPVCRAGDSVTLVYLPSEGIQSLRVYRFLGLRDRN